MGNKGWLIYNETDARRNKEYINWFISECDKQKLELHLILREELMIGIYENKLLVQLTSRFNESLPDFAVVRVIDPLLNLQLEKAGILVFNNAVTARIANDKALAHMHAAEIGIRMLDTIFIKRGNFPENSPFNFPVVLKQADGRSGQQISMVYNQKQWLEARYFFLHHDSIIQSTFVMPGKDLRVFIIGKDIIAAVLRENDHDFRANISLGGSARLYQLNAEEKSIIDKFTSVFDFGLVGIDFLFDQNGSLLFNEIEDAVGSRSLSKVSSVNLLERYTTFIKQRLLNY